MSKLMEIACTSLTENDNKEFLSESWMGTIKLEEDGWFEGIETEHTGNNQEFNFVFGIFFPNKIIELYKMFPIKCQNPRVYHGNVKRELYYTGEFESIGLLGPEYSGFSEISAFEREYNEQLAEKLDDKIEQCKNQLDDSCALFYSRYLDIRKSLCQIFLRNYKGECFTNEELEEIMPEVEPINDSRTEVVSLGR